MAFTAGQTARELPAIDLRRLLRTAARDLAGWGDAGRSPRDLLTARALASAGLAALMALPVLMLASLALGAPLAVPAAFAIGYLAVAHAISFGRPRQAAILSIAVLSGLTGWAVFLVPADGAPISWAGLASALLAPVFAAAPAVARHFIAGRPGRGRSTALQQAACLDRLAPGEAVLFLAASGELLAGTQAGLKTLGLGAQAAATDLSRRFRLADQPVLLGALRRCRSAQNREEIVLRQASSPAGADDPLAATVTGGPDGTVALRLRSLAPPAAELAGPRSARPRPVRTPAALPRHAPAPAAFCDVQEAVSFALQRVGSKARSNKAALICEGDSDVVAACDRRICRRIAHTLLDEAVAHCGAGGTVRVAARRLKGTILLRVSTQRAGPPPATSLSQALHVASLGDVVDAAGGTMQIEESDAGATVSVRLASAADPVAERRNERAQA